MNPQYYGAAAEYHKPASGGFRPNKKLFVMVGLIIGVLVLIAIGLTFVSSLSKGPTEDFKTLIARTSGLQDIIQKEQPSIRNGDLRKVNGESSVLLLSNINGLNSGFTASFSALPESIPPETDDTVATDLKNATANGNFDQTYVGIVRDKLAAAYQQASKVAGALPAGVAKQNVEALMSDLDIIDTRYKDLGL